MMAMGPGVMALKVCIQAQLEADCLTPAYPVLARNRHPARIRQRKSGRRCDLSQRPTFGIAPKLGMVLAGGGVGESCREQLMLGLGIWGSEAKPTEAIQAAGGGQLRQGRGLGWLNY